jgi:hypothetical protein
MSLLDHRVGRDDGEWSRAHDRCVIADPAHDSLAARRQRRRDRRDQGALVQRLAVAVDDPRAVEVVRGELAAHAVTRKDPDAEPAHLPRDVAEHDVVVVELDAEHRVWQGLDHLALELDLVFLWHGGGPYYGAFVPVVPVLPGGEVVVVGGVTGVVVGPIGTTGGAPLPPEEWWCVG